MTFDLRPSTFDRPRILWLIRHGQSTANLARQKAERENLPTIDYIGREMDIPLSDMGVTQSVAVGNWFKSSSEKPSVIFTSPYLRTAETARLIAENAQFENSEIIHDERIRERELGIFDRLTWLGSVQKYPEECAKREQIGKFYYRPPGGESWCDVALRVRSFWRDLCLQYPKEKILIVTHEVVVRVFRYIVEEMTEQEILAIDKSSDVENGALTSYEFEAEKGKLALKLDNYLPSVTD